MQKISGILGSSARVTAVDIKGESPVRPGTPGFGRPEGVSALKEQAVMRQRAADSLVRGPELFNEQMGIRSKEALQAKQAQKVSDSFFMKRTQPDPEEVAGEEEVTNDPVHEQVAAVMAFENAHQTAASKPSQSDYDDVAAVSKEQNAAPEGLYPKGSFVDVEA
jgi:hypothetical protein